MNYECPNLANKTPDGVTFSNFFVFVFFLNLTCDCWIFEFDKRKMIIMLKKFYILHHFILPLLLLPLLSNYSDAVNHDTCTSRNDWSIVEKNKYLPEFNIEDDLYRKWSKIFDTIQLAYQNYSESFANKNDATSCDLFIPLINSDLRYFEENFGSNFITKEFIDKMIAAKHGVHYQIVGKRLYRQSDCMFPSRCQGIEHFILEIIDQLPDMDLIINVRDYPQVGRYFPKEQQFPVLSFSKEVSSYADIIYPAWTFWSGGPALDIYPNGIGRWDLMREKLLKIQCKLSWNKKKNVAFFRGSRTSSQRDPIVMLSRSRPDLVDAKYTKNQAWKSKADTLGDDPAKTVSFEDHCEYKYLFNVHGVAASFRYKHLFLCRSLVLNVESEWIEFFYPLLKPWIHYIPIDKNFENVIELLEFLNENQLLASRIAKRGFEFIRDQLTMKTIRCYWQQLLTLYSDRLISYRPLKPNSSLIEIH